MPSGVYDRNKPRKPRGSGRITRVSFFVDDLQLADAMRALVGIAQQPPEVQPVVNVEQKPNGQLVAKSGGTAADMLAAHIAEHKPAEISGREVRALLRAAGRRASNVSKIMQTLVAQNIVKRVGKTGIGHKAVYKVVGA